MMSVGGDVPRLRTRGPIYPPSAQRHFRFGPTRVSPHPNLDNVDPPVAQRLSNLACPMRLAGL